MRTYTEASEFRDGEGVHTNDVPILEGLRSRPSLSKCIENWRQLPVTTDAMQCAGWVWRGIVAWDKTEACRPQLGRYRNQTEFVVWGTKGARPSLGGTAPGVFRAPVPRQEHHIAGKPVGLMEGLLAIMDGPILDPFMGSGTIGVACAIRELSYIGMEVDPAYFDIASTRLSEKPKPSEG